MSASLRTCLSCEAEVGSDDQVCPQCGTAQANGTPPPSDTSSIPPLAVGDGVDGEFIPLKLDPNLGTGTKYDVVRQNALAIGVTLVSSSLWVLAGMRIGHEHEPLVWGVMWVTTGIIVMAMLVKWMVSEIRRHQRHKRRSRRRAASQ